MKTIYYLPLGLIFVFSCNSAAVEGASTNTSNDPADDSTLNNISIDSSDIVSVDTTEKAVTEFDIEAFKAKFQNELDLPLILDSTQILNYRSETKDDPYNLIGDEVALLSSVFAEDDASDRASYNTVIFIDLDSMKRFGGYEEYQKNMDIGMTRYSHCNSIGYVQIEEGLRIYIWSLDYSSYEACPHSHGTYVYGSVFYNDEFQNTVLMGEESGGGDPPVWGETSLSGELSESKLITDFMDMYGEYTEEGEDEIESKTEKHFEFEITPAGFQVLQGAN